MRAHDECQVIVKIFLPEDNGSEGENELALLRHFSTPPLRDDPSNHMIPCLDSFPIPDVEGGTFVVMPLLSDYLSPSFYNLLEVHNFLDQLLEVGGHRCTEVKPSDFSRALSFYISTKLLIGINIVQYFSASQLLINKCVSVTLLHRMS